MELYSTDVNDVKSPTGSLRAERAAVTRRRITGAARTLFATRGYAATTLSQIAIAAGVAVQTVYAVFGSKAGILRALREGLVNDPAADAAFGAAVAETSPSRALELFARSIRLRWETGHDLVAIHAAAASADPMIRDEVDRVLAARRRGIAELVQSLVQHEAALRDAGRPTAIIDALTLPELYAELVDVHGWTADAYEAWLATALRRLAIETSDDDPGGVRGRPSWST